MDKVERARLIEKFRERIARWSRNNKGRVTVPLDELRAALSRVSELESALREIIAKDREHEPDLALLRQTHETGFKGGIRWCANIARNVLGGKA